MSVGFFSHVLFVRFLVFALCLAENIASHNSVAAIGSLTFRSFTGRFMHIAMS